LGVGLDLAPSDPQALEPAFYFVMGVIHSRGAEDCSDLMNLLTVQAPNSVIHRTGWGDSMQCSQFLHFSSALTWKTHLRFNLAHALAFIQMNHCDKLLSLKVGQFRTAPENPDVAFL
jgi:hypothetical protein